ncbi:single-strand-selective monofunctional uracil-DNA glycosylase [Aphomia sociella]
MEPEVMSSFFYQDNIPCNKGLDLCDEFLYVVDKLNNSLEHLILPKNVDCVYNPTIYARKTFEMYVRNYCNTKKRIMFFGMNPGPWGMSQTGVPFGEIKSVRDWLHINGPVGKPPKELLNRPVQGFNCHRNEVSGARFWGLIKKICGTPENFFRTSFVYNYLPQQWMKSNGANVTPTELCAADVMPLYNICDPIFAEVLQLYEVEIIVAIGKFCEKRAQKVIATYLPESQIEIYYLPHPSPRVANNTDWENQAMQHLKKFDLFKYYNIASAGSYV